MIKILTLIACLYLLGQQSLNALDMALDGKNDDLFNQTIIQSEVGDPLEYINFNVLDSNLNTAVAININSRSDEETKNPFFRVILKENYLFDKVIFYNGLQKSDTLYNHNSRAKEIAIKLIDLSYEKAIGGTYNKVIYDEEGKEVRVNIVSTLIFETNLELSDTKEKQLFEFSEVKGNYWIVEVLSTYPGSKYNDICISEIEFWDKGEKYNVTNLEEAKNEYYRMYVQRYFDSYAHGGMFKDLNESGYRKILKITEWNYDKPEDRYIVVVLLKDGTILLKWGFKPGYEINGKLVYRNYPQKIIGNWKFEKDGSLWIKLQNDKWKKIIFTKGDYQGTDLACDLLEYVP